MNYPPNFNPMDQYADQVAKAEVFSKGKYFDPGSYDLEIKSIIAKPGKDPQKPANWFIVNFLILASSNPEFPVGGEASWSLNMMKSMSLGNIKELILGLSNLEAKDKSLDAAMGAALRRSVQHDNPFMGMRVHLEAFHRASSKNPVNQQTGKPNVFTVHSWRGGTTEQMQRILQIAQSPGPQAYAQPQAAPPPAQFAPQYAAPAAAVAAQPPPMPPGTRLNAQWIIGPSGTPIQG